MIKLVPTKSTSPISSRSRLALTAGLVLVSLAACGRSQPIGSPTTSGAATANTGAATADTSSATPAANVGPSIAGVQVTSENPVVIAGPTSVPPTTATTVAAVGSVYVVQPGDTLSVIAEQFGIRVDAITRANGIADEDRIKPGQELIIPAAS